MHMIRNIVAAAIMAATVPGAAAAQSPPLDTAKIAQVIAAALKEFNVPGAAVAIDTPGARWVQTFGYANYATARPVATRDYFAIRSITKSFTVTAVLQLVAASQGAVRLDDTIGSYLPDIPNGNIITIRELCNMTSGLYNYTADPNFGRLFGGNPTRRWSVDQLLHFALYSKQHSAINFAPGAQYQYSNTNTLLLGKLVEYLTGKKFPATLRTAILQQTGLGGMVYMTGVDLPRPATSGYQGFFDNQPDAVSVSATSLSFAGAMASNISDLASWGEVLVGGELLPPKLQQERFHARITAGDANSPLYDRYGLGMGELAGWWGHTGEGVGYEAAVFHDIGKAETFAILLNASNAKDVPAHIFCRILTLLGGKGGAGGKSACDKEPG